MGASVLSRDPNLTAAVNDIKELKVDPNDPEHLYVAGYTGNEGAGNYDGWLGKIHTDDLSKDAAVIYGDAALNRFNAMCLDNTYVYCAGRGAAKALVIKYLKSDLSKSAAVELTTATQSDGICESGDYVYAVCYSTEGAAAASAYIAELNKSDLSINADYYSEDAVGNGGEPTSSYEGVTCDGTNVFACGKETISGTTKSIVDKFNVAGLGSGAAYVITYGTSVTLYRVTYDETYLYLVGWDDKATDIGVVIKIKKSDMSIDSAASFTSADGACRLMNIVEDGDYFYASGYSYYAGAITDNCGILIKMRKSDLGIESQQAFQKTSTPQDTQMWSIDKDSSHIYTATDETGSGLRTIVKWNKGMLVTGYTSPYTVAAGNVTKAAITPTIASSTRVLSASGDSVSASNLTAAASTVTMDALRTIGATVPAAYSTDDRILGVVQTELPYGEQCEIILDNSDKALSSVDSRGTLLNLAFGFTVASTNYYSYIPVLYVYKQEDISYAGKLFTRLLCIGNWTKLEMHEVMGDTIASVPSTDTDTVWQIISKRKLSGMELVKDTSDGTEDTKVPNAKYEVSTDRKTIIQECNGLTENLLRLRGGNMHMIKKDNSQQHRIVGTISGTFVAGETVTQAVTAATGKFVYQTSTYIVVEAQTGTFTESANTVTGGTSAATVANPSTIDAYDYLYGPLAGDHTFYEHVRTLAILEANRIIAVDALPDTDATLHTYPSSDSYYANDTDDQKAFGICTLIFEDPSIASDAEAQAAAEARLEHIKNEAQGGELIAPMNCGQEMYDYVQIDDDRAGWTSGSEIANRVTKITRTYAPGKYTIELGFGGLEWQYPKNFELSLLIPEPELLTEGVFPGPTPDFRPQPPAPAPKLQPPTLWPVSQEKASEVHFNVGRSFIDRMSQEEYTQSRLAGLSGETGGLKGNWPETVEEARELMAQAAPRFQATGKEQTPVRDTKRPRRRSPFEAFARRVTPADWWK